LKSTESDVKKSGAWARAAGESSSKKPNLIKSYENPSARGAVKLLWGKDRCRRFQTRLGSAAGQNRENVGWRTGAVQAPDDCGSEGREALPTAPDNFPDIAGHVPVIEA
jgi:hypothetical protein